jgi:putative membrane protein
VPPSSFDKGNRVTYFWIKSLHLLFVIAWLAAVFYLPRILVNMAEAVGQPAVIERLGLMGRRLYRFGHHMFGLAVLFGVTLYIGHYLAPTLLPDVVGNMKWIHAKLGLVALLLAYYIVMGRWLKRAAAGGGLPSSTALRWINELPILLVLGVIYLVIAKPM